MKKILLASTILVGSAGIAAADNANFTFSGEASVGVAYNLTNTGQSTVYGSTEFTVGMMTTTDMGMEAGASITITAGTGGMETDHTETNFGMATTSLGSISNASVYLSGDWGKLTAEYDDPFGADFGYSGTWGDFTIAATYDWDFVATDEASLKGTYAFGDYSVYAGINAYEAGGWSVDDIDFGASAAMSGFSLAVDANYDFTALPGDELTWKASVGYATGAYEVGAFIENDDNAGVSLYDYGVDASYDLGGGVSIDAALIYDGDSDQTIVTAGVGMNF